MRFQKEVNIFARNAILKRFQANETNFSVLKGRIEALISESEIIELQNSKVTMYSKLASIKLTVDGLSQSYTDISSKYDSVSGKYTNLDAKVAEYKSGVDGLSQNLSQVQSNLKSNYSTTTAMNAAIKAQIDGFSSTVSSTYATGANVEQKLKAADSAAKGYADAAKKAAIDTAKVSTDELLKSYATIKQMQSAIDQKADSITSTVSSTYATKASVTSLETWKKEASQKITNSAIISTVSSSSAWNKKADKASLISQINQSAESVSISASKIKLEGVVTANNYFRINADGSMNVEHGTIGGWDIENDSLSANGITLSAKEGKLKVCKDDKEILQITSNGMALNNTDEITIMKLITSGMYFYDSTGKKRKVTLGTAGMALYTDYTDANNYKALRLGKYGIYAIKKAYDDAETLWMEGKEPDYGNIDDWRYVWDGYIIKYSKETVQVNTNKLYTQTFKAYGNAAFDGTLYFYDWEQQALSDDKKVGRRQPVASVTSEGSRVAYISVGQTGSGKFETSPGEDFDSEIMLNYLNVRGQFTGQSTYSTHKIYSGSAPSDARLKKNVKDSKINALETIKQMRVRQFDWRGNNAHQNIGFVADELEKIDPNLALGGGYDENGEMDIKQINSPYLLNYAVKAIQELSENVQNQNKHIEELERRLS